MKESRSSFAIAEFESQVNSEAIAPVSEIMGITAILLIVFLSRTLFANEMTSLSAVLLTYLLVLLRLLPFISQLNTLRSSFASTATSVEIVTDFLRWDNKPLMGNGDIPYTKLEKGIHFNHISFSYPGHEKLVLEDVDLYLPHGTTLALVGSSGAGKSTLADLLPRFYDPTSGCITLDGKDIREFNLKSLRTAMGIVSQDTFLFNDSVRTNITYGRPEATEEELLAAAKLANAYEFINKLPQGFDTLIGDRGVMLSGGQRQRLAIARALLQDPEILILDEATSALDTVSERLVQNALDNLSRDRTTMVIAHRLSTVQKADRIAVLDLGRVVEVGTHEELLQKGGYYSRLYSMQFAERAETKTKQQQTLIRIYNELHKRLNSLIDLLSSILNNTTDNSLERHELIFTSYKSALKLFNTIDIFDDLINLQKEGEQYGFPQPHHQIFKKISDEFGIRIEPILALRSLSDDLIDQPQQQNQLIVEAYDSAKHLLGILEHFEDSIKL